MLRYLRYFQLLLGNYRLCFYLPQAKFPTRIENKKTSKKIKKTTVEKKLFYRWERRRTDRIIYYITDRVLANNVASSFWYFTLFLSFCQIPNSWPKVKNEVSFSEFQNGGFGKVIVRGLNCRLRKRRSLISAIISQF